jgi:hypothetical protein
VLPDRLPEEALMVAEPGANTVARPVLLTVATAGFEDVQATSAVMLEVDPSE